MQVQMPTEARRGCQIPQAGVLGGCELPNVGAGN